MRGLSTRDKISAQEMRLYWDRFFSSEQYRENLKQRILDGEVQGMEQYLHTMVYGKPRETVKVQSAGDGVFILQIGGDAQAHVIDGGKAEIITGTIEDVQRALPETTDIAIGAEDDEPPPDAEA